MKGAFNAIMMFADGASLGNPGPGGWGVILSTPDGQVVELGGNDRETTNNRMELTAIIRGLGYIADIPSPVSVYSDSAYVLNGITAWIWGWRKNNWKTAEGGEVANSDLWKVLFAVVMKRGKDNSVSWHHLKGHSGIPGNERTDQIATSFAKGRPTSLYRGPLLQYPVALMDLPDDTSIPKPSGPKTPKPKAYSYLSVVGGVLRRHSTWEECERQVKGRSGAKFKKASSAEDERSLIQAWGYKPTDVKE